MKALRSAVLAVLVLSLIAAVGVSAQSREFEAAALRWTASPDFSGEILVRASADGAAWTEWRKIAIDEDMTDRSAGEYFSGIVHFGAAKRFFQYSSTQGLRAEVTYFDPPRPRQPWRKHSESFKLGSIDVVSRSEWGCPDGQGSRWTPSHTPVTHTIVHHTAGSNQAPDWAAAVRNVWEFHTIGRGWGDIGYNYLIDPNGVVYEGRAGGDNALGAHFSCRNTNTVGVALLGTFSTVTPTPAAVNSLKALLRELLTRFALDPAAITVHAPSTLMMSTISGHRDGNPGVAIGRTCTITECPGEVLYAMLPTFRAELAAPPAPPAQVPNRRRAARP